MAKSCNKASADFSLSLTRPIELRRYPMIAEVTMRRERKDIAALLQEANNNAADLPNRLKKYLAREGLWREDQGLTDKAKAVLDSDGLYDTGERGYYHIWYTHKDKLLHSRPVLLQRDSTFAEPKDQTILLEGTAAENSEFKVATLVELQVYDDKSSKPMSIRSLEPKVICDSHRQKELNLQWRLSPTESIVKIDGSLDVMDFSDKTSKKTSEQPYKLGLTINRPSANDINAVMSAIASALGGQWHEDKSNISVTLGQLQQIERNLSACVKEFRVHSWGTEKLESDFGEFQAKAQNLPIQPQDSADANDWHQLWLAEFYSAGYQSSAKAYEQQSRWLDNPAIAEFDLPIAQHDQLLEKLSRDSNPVAYWHAAAIADLSPAQSNKLRMPISLRPDGAFNLRDLIRQLSGNEKIKSLIISDRYIKSKDHELLQEIHRLTNAQRTLLLTLKLKRGDHEVQLPDGDIWRLERSKKNNDNHSRYWIFIGTDNIYCWECSASLDYLNKGTIKNYLTFTPKAIEDLPPYLRAAIDNNTDAE